MTERLSIFVYRERLMTERLSIFVYREGLMTENFAHYMHMYFADIFENNFAVNLASNFTDK